MKRLSNFFVALALISLPIAIFSCKDEKDDETIGLTSLKLVLSGGKSYDFVLNQTANTAVNSQDSLPSNTPDALLQTATVQYTTTLGAELYYSGAKVETTTEIDFTGAVTLEVKKGSVNRTYTVSVVKATQDKSATEGEKLTSDVRLSGFPQKAIRYEVVYFNDKFYAAVVSYDATDDKSFYEIYSSVDGTQWTKVNTTPNSIGGVESRLVVFKDRLHLLSGGRFWGTDENGVPAEAVEDWSGAIVPRIAAYRAWSSADGVSWESDTTGVDPAKFPRLTTTMNGFAYNTVVFKDQLWIYAGQAISYGQSQTTTHLFSSTDGKEWTNIITQLSIEGLTIPTLFPSSKAAFFVFKDKLYMLGGHSNFIGYDNVSSKVYSSEDGLVWTVESVETAIGKIYGASVVTDGDVLYLFGGETIDSEGTKTLSNKVYRSTNAIDWEEVSIASAYEARRNPSVAVVNNTAWVFGGIKSITSGNYGAPEKNDELLFDVWTKKIQ